MTENKIEEKVEAVKEDQLETQSFILNDHYKRPMSFVAYLDGREGEKTRVLIDKEHDYLFIGDIWIREGQIQHLLNQEVTHWDSAEPELQDQSEVLYFKDEYTRVDGPIKHEAWVNKAQLIQLLRDNTTCKFMDQLCSSSCAYRYSDPRGSSTDCIYKHCATFREFAKNQVKYLNREFECADEEGMFHYFVSLNFLIPDYNKRTSWGALNGDMYLRDDIRLYLLDTGYQIQTLENGDIQYILGWSCIKGIKVTILLHPDGSGTIHPEAVYEECYRSTDSCMSASYKSGDVMEGLRDLCYRFDKKIQLIPAEKPMKEVPCWKCDHGEDDDEEDYD